MALTFGCILHLVLACPAFLGEGGLDFVLLAEVPDHKTSACDPYSNFPGNSFTKSLNAVRTSTYEGFLSWISAKKHSNQYLQS